MKVESTFFSSTRLVETAKSFIQSEKTERIGNTALSILSLHSATNHHINILGSGKKALVLYTTMAQELFNGNYRRGMSNGLYGIVHTAILVGWIFQEQVTGIVLTTYTLGSESKDLTMNLTHCKWKKSLISLYKVVNTSCSLATKFIPSPELIIASFALKILFEFGCAVSHAKKGNQIEAFGSLILVLGNSYHAYPAAKLLQRKWEVLTDPKFSSIRNRIDEGQNTNFLKGHPLENLVNTINKQSVRIKDAIIGVIDLGAHFHPFGGKVVKGQNLNFRVKKLSGETITELDFTLNHVYREKLEAVIKEYQQYDPKELSEFLFFAGIGEGMFSIQKVPFKYTKQNPDGEHNPVTTSLGKIHEIEFRGLGKIQIGASKDVVSLYDEIRVQMGQTKDETDLHLLLSLADMGQVLKPSTTEEVERLKIGQLFRVYHPMEATNLERSEPFFQLTLDDLKKTIYALRPSMKKHLEKDLKKMESVEVLPGRVRYTIPHLAKRAKNLGARALFSGFSASAEDGAKILSNILRYGSLSTKSRFNAGLLIEGAGSNNDHLTGGADSVFTRLIPESALSSHVPINTIPLSGNFQLIYSLDVLNTATYQYNYNAYGTREINSYWSYWSEYLHRPSLFNFVRNEQKSFNHYNELMVKDAINPGHIVGCILPNNKVKHQVITFLNEQGVLHQRDGVTYYRDIPVDQFFHVSKYFTDQIISPAWKHLS